MPRSGARMRLPIALLAILALAGCGPRAGAAPVSGSPVPSADPSAAPVAEASPAREAASSLWICFRLLTDDVDSLYLESLIGSTWSNVTRPPITRPEIRAGEALCARQTDDSYDDTWKDAMVGRVEPACGITERPEDDYVRWELLYTPTRTTLRMAGQEASVGSTGEIYLVTPGCFAYVWVGRPFQGEVSIDMEFRIRRG